MKIEEILDFFQKEMPQSRNTISEFLKETYGFAEEKKKNVDHGILVLLENRNYKKAQEYMSMSEKISDILTYISKLELICDSSTVEKQNDKESNVQEGMEQPDVNSVVDKRINYEEFRVDETIPYDIMTDFCHMRPAAFSFDNIKYPARLWKTVLLKTCEILWNKNNTIFENFLEDRFMHGKTRIYFSKNKGNMAKPEKILNTDIYVETNLSANGTRDLIVKMLDQYRIPHDSYKIYLSKDLNPLHIDVENDEVNEDVSINNSEEIDAVKYINMQDICSDFDYKTGKCMNEDAPNFIMECCRKSNCLYKRNCNSTKSNVKSISPIYVLSRKVFKKKKCINCGNEMKGSMFTVKYKDGFGEKVYKLHGEFCAKCERAYITDGLYATFTKNKLLENMITEFLFDSKERLNESN